MLSMALVLAAVLSVHVQLPRGSVFLTGDWNKIAPGRFLSAANNESGTLANLLGVDDRSLAALQGQLTGNMVGVGAPDYENHSRVEFALGDFQAPKPIVIIRAKNTNDVRNTVAWARQNQVSISPAAGKHGSAGYCFANAIGLDLSGLNDIVFNGESHEVRVGAGVKFDAVAEALSQHGHMTGTGVCSSVGVAGWTLGGGYGPLTKMLGLGVDNVKEFEVVTANASVVRANLESHPDLFWALRGAGHQSFGYVTAITMRTVPLQSIQTHSITVQMEADPEWAALVLKKWHELHLSAWSATALSTYAVRFGRQFSSSSPLVMNIEFVLAEDGADAEAKILKLLQPFHDFVGPRQVYNESAKVPFTGFGTFDASFEKGINTTSSQKGLESNSPEQETPVEGKVGVYVKQDLTLDDCRRVIRSMLTYLDLERSSPLGFKGVYAVLEVYDGAATHPQPSDTAFYHRHGILGDLYIDVLTDRSSPSAASLYAHGMDWLESFYKHGAEPAKLSGLLKLHNGVFTAYQNYKQPRYGEGDARSPALHNYYAGNLCRLVQIKKAYDPDMVFDFPQGIPLRIEDCDDLQGQR